MSVPHFSFYEYVDNIKELVSDAFPDLETVTFPPAKDGEDVKYSDFGVPAFLMNFENTEPLNLGVSMRDVDVEDTGRTGGALSEMSGYYMDIRVNVSGALVIPRFVTDGQNDDDLNPLLASHQAITNIAALIYAKARGWNCDPPIMGEISYEPDENYHVMLLTWSHTATVGRESGDSSPFLEGWGKWINCPTVDEDDVDSELVLRQET